jgi:lysozyme
MSDALSTAARLAESFEGFRATPYQDVAGYWTIGYGSRVDINGQPVTGQTAAVSPSQADWMMQRDLKAAFSEIAATVRVTLTSNETAAFADFIYNLGAGNWQASSLLRLLNAGNYAGAIAQLDLWDRAGGQVFAGLLRRRQAETALAETPDGAQQA